MQGISCEPGLGHKVYALALNKKRLKDGKMPDVMMLEDEPGGGAIPDVDADGIVGPVKHPEPTPKAAASRTARADRTTTARGSRDPPPPTPAPTPIANIVVHTTDPPGGGGGGHGGGNGGPGGSRPFEGPGGPACESGSDSDSGEIIAGPVVERGVRGRNKPRPPGIPGLIPGSLISWVDYITPAGKPYPNYRMECPRCPADTCSKVCGDIPGNCRASGDIEPIAFLHSWISCDNSNLVKMHNKLRPTAKDVRAYAEANRDELVALRRRLLEHAQEFCGDD